MLKFFNKELNLISYNLQLKYSCNNDREKGQFYFKME